MPRKPKLMTDEEVVKAANDLARDFYLEHGYVVPEGYRFDLASHPQEQSMWNLACIAFKKLADTDPADALSSIDDEGDKP